MRILIICSFHDNYVEQLYTYVGCFYPDVKYSIMTSAEAGDEYKKHLSFDEDNEIFTSDSSSMLSFGEAIDRLPHFDIIHALWIEPVWGIWAHKLVKKCDKMYVHVGGSDLYRDAKKLPFRLLQKRFLRYSDCFSSENSQTRDYFKLVYGSGFNSKPHHIVRFGIDILDNIDNLSNVTRDELKRKWNMPNGKIAVMLGHNARKEHNHRDMLEAIEGMAVDVRDNLHLIIPMTYGEPYDGYIDEIENRTKSVTSNYTIIRDYMNNDQMAELALVTDIMVHVQETDQMSSTMLAHMYIGNPVIAGSWLPYGILTDNGIKFWSIDKISDMSELLKHMIDTWPDYKIQCDGNKECVNAMSSWENMSREWHNIYLSLLN